MASCIESHFLNLVIKRKHCFKLLTGILVILKGDTKPPPLAYIIEIIGISHHLRKY